MSEIHELIMEEGDGEIRKLAEDKNIAMLAIIAPFIPYRV